MSLALWSALASWMLPAFAQKICLMVYLHADNNLDPFARSDLEEMIVAPAINDPNLLLEVFIDRHASYDGPVQTLYNQSGAAITNHVSTALYLHWNRTQERMIANTQLGEIDSDSMATMTNFVVHAINRCKADGATQFMLVFWNHGGGYSGFGGDAQTRRLAGASNADMHHAVNVALSNTSVGKLDVLGFDACLMGAYSVLSTWKDTAKYVLASQALEPGHGWYWTALQNPTSATALAEELLIGFVENPQGPYHQVDKTLSLVEMEKFEVFDSFFEEFLTGATTQLRSNDTQLSGLIGRSLSLARSFYVGIDLGYFLQAVKEGLNPGSEAATKLDNTINAYRSMVILNRVGPGSGNTTGMSVVFERYPNYDWSEYSTTTLSILKPWLDFVDAFHGADKPSSECCKDTADSLTDSGGDGCDWYASREEACGRFDTSYFSARIMCCVCGGGAVGPPTCRDTDDGHTDTGGDGCSWYDGFSSDADLTQVCGRYDTASFNASDMCCACGGGSADIPVNVCSPMESPTPAPTPTTPAPPPSPMESPTPAPTPTTPAPPPPTWAPNQTCEGVDETQPQLIFDPVDNTSGLNLTVSAKLAPSATEVFTAVGLFMELATPFDVSFLGDAVEPGKLPTLANYLAVQQTASLGEDYLIQWAAQLYPRFSGCQYNATWDKNFVVLSQAGTGRRAILSVEYHMDEHIVIPVYWYESGVPKVGIGPSQVFVAQPAPDSQYQGMRGVLVGVLSNGTNLQPLTLYADQGGMTSEVFPPRGEIVPIMSFSGGGSFEGFTEIVGGWSQAQFDYNPPDALELSMVSVEQMPMMASELGLAGNVLSILSGLGYTWRFDSQRYIVSTRARAWHLDQSDSFTFINEFMAATPDSTSAPTPAPTPDSDQRSVDGAGLPTPGVVSMALALALALTVCTEVLPSLLP